MQACPSHALQSAWLQAGMGGLFSPVHDPRSGACLPECVRCGTVCPTHAILPLPLSEKRWARVGIATLKKDLCLAWAEDKRCMVCKENCPYGAVDVVVQPGHVAAVPVVDETRCYGCGFCEHHCPKPVSAIVVEARGALCLAEGLDFEKDARRRGLRLDATKLPLTMRQCRIWTGLGRLLAFSNRGLAQPRSGRPGLSLRPQIGSSREGETFCVGTVIWRLRGRSRGPGEPWAWASPVCQPARSGNKSQNEHVRKIQKPRKNFYFMFSICCHGILKEIVKLLF